MPWGEESIYLKLPYGPKGFCKVGLEYSQTPQTHKQAHLQPQTQVKPLWKVKTYCIVLILGLIMSTHEKAC